MAGRHNPLRCGTLANRTAAVPYPKAGNAGKTLLSALRRLGSFSYVHGFSG